MTYNSASQEVPRVDDDGGRDTQEEAPLKVDPTGKQADNVVGEG